MSLGLAGLMLLGGGTLLSSSHHVSAQYGSVTPAATEVCATQSASATAESDQDGVNTPEPTENAAAVEPTESMAATLEPTEAVDVDNVGPQCDDKNAPDNRDSTDSENNIEATQSPTDNGGDNVDQQDAGEVQPTPTSSVK